LLATEREEEFRELHTALVQELKPRGAVEKIFVGDLAACVWEILRLRRAKTALINMGFEGAKFQILYRLEDKPSPDSLVYSELQGRAIGWTIGNEEDRKQMSSTLKEYSLDETAIEAEAIRRNASELERFERMHSAQEARRDKVLRAMADYRESFANQARAASHQIIEAVPVIQLENRSAQNKK
jgi:hypothetical protein